MKHDLTSLLAATAVVLALAFGFLGPAAAAADGDCLGKRQIQQQIDSGQLRPLSDAMAAANVDGKIISSGAEVCQIDGQWQWRVNVMDSYGESKPVTLPAE